jgi:hypothetical protein
VLIQPTGIRIVITKMHTKYLVSKKLIVLCMKLKQLQSCRRKVVLIPQKLVVFNDTASDVEEGFALQLARNGMYPRSVAISCENQDGNGATYFVMFS